jgi:hypothetical protein
MQTYPIFCTLTKDWISHRGHLYHSGTTFKRVRKKQHPPGSGHPGDWYEFESPKKLPLPYTPSYGIVFIPHSIFLKFTKEREEMEKHRSKERKEHMKKTEEDFFH